MRRFFFLLCSPLLFFACSYVSCGSGGGSSTQSSFPPLFQSVASFGCFSSLVRNTHMKVPASRAGRSGFPSLLPSYSALYQRLPSISRLFKILRRICLAGAGIHTALPSLPPYLFLFPRPYSHPAPLPLLWLPESSTFFREEGGGELAPVVALPSWQSHMNIRPVCFCGGE